MAAGEQVAAGQKLFTLEAMKMETTVYAERAGKVAEVLVQPARRSKRAICCCAWRSEAIRAVRVPRTAPLLRLRLFANLTALDLSAGAAGALFGREVAVASIEYSQVRKGMVIVGETGSYSTSWTAT